MPKYTNDDVIKAVETSNSIAQTCRYLGLVPIGGNYQTVNRLIKRLKLDVKHFTGQGWNIGNYKHINDCKSRTGLKTNLIRQRGHRCESCSRKTWKGKIIPLELEHVDGDTSNNTENNLKLLCPNCHSFTPTYRRKKSSLVPKEGFEPTLPSS